jgi:hypothetical protein
VLKLNRDASGTCHGVHGFACGRDDLVISGSLEAREFVAFWLTDQRVQAAMAVNTWERMTDVENPHPVGAPDAVRGAWEVHRLNRPSQITAPPGLS